MKEHICKTIENCDFVTIVSEDDRKWLWKFSPKIKRLQLMEYYIVHIVGRN